MSFKGPTTATLRPPCEMWFLDPNSESHTRPSSSTTIPLGLLFLILPKDASAKLPTRGMTTVEGIINGHPFRATLEPDGQKSHWLKVNKKTREAAGAEVGDVVPLEIQSVGKEPELRVPADLRKALAAAPEARAVWSDLTPIARRDWIHWITSAKRGQRLARAGSTMLAVGKRRVCCFDRSGFYSKNFGAPKAAD